MPDVPESLPWDTRKTYLQLLEQPSLSQEKLLEQISGYLRSVERASGDNEFLDTRSARALGTALRKLIEVCPVEHFHHLQAAVAYFIHSDDAEHDFDSVVGFDDDIAVFNAVCDHVGHRDLKVPE